MRKENIELMKVLIKEKKGERYAKYDELKREYERRHKTTQIDDVMTEGERAALGMAKKDYDAICELYRDFLEYKW